MTERGWALLGLFIVIDLVEPVLVIANYFQYTRGSGIQFYPSQADWAMIGNILYDRLYYSGGFLGLILAGILFARRRGAITIFLPLGFLIPTVLYGRVTDYTGSNPENPSLVMWISLGVIVYRMLLALIAPCWVARSSQERRRLRAAAVASFLALWVWIALSITVFFSKLPLSSLRLLDIPISISGQLWIAAGIGLALVLFRRTIPKRELAEEPRIVRY
jgi:hypothetical protein